MVLLAETALWFGREFSRRPPASSLTLSVGCATAGLISFLRGAPSTWAPLLPPLPSPIPAAPSPAPCSGFRGLLPVFLPSCPANLFCPQFLTLAHCHTPDIGLFPAPAPVLTSFPDGVLLPLYSSDVLLSFPEAGCCSSPGMGTHRVLPVMAVLSQEPGGGRLAWGWGWGRVSWLLSTLGAGLFFVVRGSSGHCCCLAVTLDSLHSDVSRSPPLQAV